MNLAIQIPVLVDGIDNTTERAYTAWPERMYLIGKGGLVIFKSRPGPFGFRIEELAKALRLEAERDEKVPTYGSLVLRVQDAIHRHVPDMATVMVISKGDDALLQLNGRRAWHFPQDSNGHYAGHYPGDTSEVISDLQGLCSKGAEYLVLPEAAFWWLDHYDGFRQYLDTQHERIWGDDACIIYRLTAARMEAGV